MNVEIKKSLSLYCAELLSKYLLRTEIQQNKGLYKGMPWPKIRVQEVKG